jgi:hypothetical protein
MLYLIIPTEVKDYWVLIRPQKSVLHCSTFCPVGYRYLGYFKHHGHRTLAVPTTMNRHITSLPLFLLFLSKNCSCFVYSLFPYSVLFVFLAWAFHIFPCTSLWRFHMLLFDVIVVLRRHTTVFVLCPTFLNLVYFRVCTMAKFFSNTISP